MSVQERYGTIGTYNYLYSVAVKGMIADRTLLAEAGAAMVSPLLPVAPPSN